jgi:hypothetical protein
VTSEVPASPAATSPATAQVVVPTSEPEVQNIRIAYTDDGNLWALEIGSDPMQLTVNGGISDVRISDDGEWIAYVVQNPDQDTAELHSASFDGSSHQLLLNADSFDALYPLGPFIHYTLSSFEFLLDSHTLLFNTRGVFEGPGLAKNDDLLAIDVANGQIAPLLPRGDGGDFTASPSGDQIAIVRPDSLGFVNADGAGLRPEVLTFTPVITYSEYFFYPLPVWAGAEVVLPVPQQDPFFAGEPGTVWSVNGESQTLSRPDGDLFGLPMTPANSTSSLNDWTAAMKPFMTPVRFSGKVGGPNRIGSFTQREPVLISIWESLEPLQRRWNQARACAGSTPTNTSTWPETPAVGRLC